MRDKGMSVVSKKDGLKMDYSCIGLPRGIGRAEEKKVKKLIRDHKLVCDEIKIGFVVNYR